jgi:hypothetical protein
MKRETLSQRMSGHSRRRIPASVVARCVVLAMCATALTMGGVDALAAQTSPPASTGLIEITQVRNSDLQSGAAMANGGGSLSAEYMRRYGANDFTDNPGGSVCRKARQTTGNACPSVIPCP